MANLTFIDYMIFRCKTEPLIALESIKAIFGDLGGGIKGVKRDKGWNGFEHTQDIFLHNIRVGFMAYGNSGDQMRDWIRVEISGVGCKWIQDWSLVDQVAEIIPEFQFRRIDIAFDTFEREVLHQHILDAHDANLFTTNGSPPECNVIAPHNNESKGRTVYIGCRDQFKYLRCYEKGFEIASQYPGIEMSHINGFPIGDLYRVELELKAKAKEKDIPLDIIKNRDSYFAGAYPFLEQVLKTVNPMVIRSFPDKSKELALESALGLIRKQYGDYLFTALSAHSGDVAEVWKKIVGSKHSEKLLQSGILMNVGESA